MSKEPSEFILKKYGSLENYKQHVSKSLSGKHFYTNGIEDRKFADGDSIPEGWYKGRTNYGPGTKGRIWINNGTERKLIPKDSAIPDGWVTGTISFSKEHKEKISSALKNKPKNKQHRENIKKAHNTAEYKQNIENTMLAKYGVKNPYQIKEVREKAIRNSHTPEALQKQRATCKERLGVEYPMQSEKVKQTLKENNLQKYGYENVFQVPEIREKIKQVNLARYGVEYASQSELIKEKIKQTCLERYGVDQALKSEVVKEKIRQSNLNNRGVPYPLKDPAVLQKQIQTNLSKYGVMYNVQLPQSYMTPSRDSKPNREFASLLDKYNIEYTREFALDMYSFDFKVDNILIEIDPSATHNSLWSPFGDHSGLDKDYHYKKSKYAESKGYRVIHVFDWDNKEVIAKSLTKKDIISIKDIVLSNLTVKEARSFLEEYHIQESNDNFSICLGFKIKDTIIALMTFKKSIQNNWELLQYCSVLDIVNGPEILFEKFIDTYKPNTVIAYCDKSKFDNDLYTRLGFEFKYNEKPDKHWYNSYDRSHLINASNEEYLIKNGYDLIYDCGQDVYEVHHRVKYHGAITNI